MQREYNIVIADASCFILFDKIDELNILQRLFDSVTTTPEIAAEFGKSLPVWVLIKEVKNKNYQSLLQLEVDKGKASAIALYMEEEKALLIVDDSAARKLATSLHLRFTGSLGIILKAKQANIINSVKPIFDKIQQTNFRYSEKVFKEILTLAGE